MSILNIRPAEREGARLVIGLAGVSGCGKTYSAIMLGYGLANYDATKVGLMDAENRRGSLYADILQNANPPTDKRFLIGDLVPPFSPARYIEGIQEFEKAGVEVLIIDSISHEHEGPGGLIDIAGDQNKFWNHAKREHKRFMSQLLQSDMHIIVCVRAREKAAPTRVKDEQTGKMKTEYVDEGLQPVTEKNVIFEMTASLMMHDEGRRQTKIKVPSALLGIMGRETGYLTAADGKALRDWVGGAKQLDPAVERFRNRLLSNCEKGKAHIEDCWAKTPEEIRTELGEPFHEMIVASARSWDDQRAEQAAEPTADAPASTAQKIAAAAAAGAASTPALAKPVETPKEAVKVATEKPAAKPKAETPPKEPPANVTALRPTAAPVTTTATAAKRVLEDPLF